MISIDLFLAIIWLHLFADFILQSDKMAKGKSKSNGWLLTHVSTYSLPFLVFFGWKYALANFTAHIITDYISSRITSHLWQKNEVHWFFVVVGIDQALHMTALILTIPLIGP